MNIERVATATTQKTEFQQYCEGIDAVSAAVARSRNPIFMLAYCEGGYCRENLETLFDCMREYIEGVRKPTLREMWLEEFDEMHRERISQLPSFPVMPQ